LLASAGSCATLHASVPARAPGAFGRPATLSHAFGAYGLPATRLHAFWRIHIEDKSKESMGKSVPRTTTEVLNVPVLRTLEWYVPALRTRAHSQLREPVVCCCTGRVQLAAVAAGFSAPIEFGDTSLEVRESGVFIAHLIPGFARAASQPVLEKRMRRPPCNVGAVLSGLS
jgi:hypothetical protein